MEVDARWARLPADVERVPSCAIVFRRVSRRCGLAAALATLPTDELPPSPIASWSSMTIPRCASCSSTTSARVAFVVDFGFGWRADARTHGPGTTGCHRARPDVAWRGRPESGARAAKIGGHADLDAVGARRGDRSRRGARGRCRRLPGQAVQSTRIAGPAACPCCGVRDMSSRLRPRAAQRAEGSPTGPHLHTFGPYTLDTAAWRLLRGDSEIAISTAEFQLLRVFVEHPNRVLSRDDLIERLKGYERSAFDRSIDVRVTRLRRRIEADADAPCLYPHRAWRGLSVQSPGCIGLMRA